jgi:DNA polymerase III epsilon subunit-like protein
MKFFSIDVETTGLSKKTQLIQLGCVCADTEQQPNEWATFETIVKQTWIQGEPFALNMNRKYY